jgi:hypothetical protein
VLNNDRRFVFRVKPDWLLFQLQNIVITDLIDPNTMDNQFDKFDCKKNQAIIWDKHMKTVLLEIEDSSYNTLLNFINNLPKNVCRVLDDDDSLSQQESAHIQKMMMQIEQGDYSEFVDWDIVKSN